ncbi:uncharacterized protein LOC109844313 [Asparagus officinalis]|uniref:uncharacterized protein LOC109844313 n=1 Tax=Asparagus officinalis TaxID=4686 RepID=UPI00098E2738|nr:uncharacterized protein LOC109844313 [Asparagus officinalis]
MDGNTDTDDYQLSSQSDSDSDSDEEQFVVLLTIHAFMKFNGSFMEQPRSQRISKLSGHDWVIEVLGGHPGTCFDLFRMKKEAFINLCEELKRIGKLKHSRNVTIQEQVAIFLFVLSHNERQRMVADRFQHSLETISTYFKRVLYAICSLTKYVIVPPSYDATPPEISYTTKYYPYFKGL